MKSEARNRVAGPRCRARWPGRAETVVSGGPCYRPCVWDGNQSGPSVGVPGAGEVFGVSLINLRSTKLVKWQQKRYTSRF